MTILGRAVSLFPLLHFGLIILSSIQFINNTNMINTVVLIFSIYIFPLIIYKIHNFLYPNKPGVFKLDSEQYIPWWGMLKFQTLFNYMPVFESILYLIPGLYSLWLRAWGSKIGKNVYWAGGVDITDRHLLDIEDNVIIGYKTTMVSHAITLIKSDLNNTNNLMLYTKAIKIKHNAMLGGYCKIGPGVTIEANTVVKANSIIKPENYK